MVAYKIEAGRAAKDDDLWGWCFSYDFWKWLNIIKQELFPKALINSQLSASWQFIWQRRCCWGLLRAADPVTFWHHTLSCLLWERLCCITWELIQHWLPWETIALPCRSGLGREKIACLVFLKFNLQQINFDSSLNGKLFVQSVISFTLQNNKIISVI